MLIQNYIIVYDVQYTHLFLYVLYLCFKTIKHKKFWLKHFVQKTILNCMGGAYIKQDYNCWNSQFASFAPEGI